MSKFEEFYKKMSSGKVKKAEAQAIHSEKWDKCVMEVKESGTDADPYAVCTAMLGTEAYKSMDEKSFGEKIKLYMEKLGISAAGPVPNSLLAAQDLEGDTTEKSIKKSTDMSNFSVWYYDKTGARKCAVFPDIIDAKAFAVLVDGMGFTNVQILKSGDQPAEKTLVDNIQDIQIKRQQADLNARQKTTIKSFRNFWTTGRGTN